MVLLIANQLDVPLRERNGMLLAAGFAPVYGERSLGDAEMAAARQAIDIVLRGHEPYPASDGAGSVHELGGVLIPLRLASPVGDLSFLTTTTVFGTPMDVTLAELAIESFFPADEATAERLRALDA